MSLANSLVLRYYVKNVGYDLGYIRLRFRLKLTSKIAIIL